MTGMVITVARAWSPGMARGAGSAHHRPFARGFFGARARRGGLFVLARVAHGDALCRRLSRRRL